VEQRLDTYRVPLEQFFGIDLSAREGPSFLRYGPGGFYKPHRDHGNVASWAGAARRRIALIVFLNSARELAPTGDFAGGALRLFAEHDEGGAIDVRPREGTLVAFPATTLHEVAIVHDGTRDTIVDWFY